MAHDERSPVVPADITSAVTDRLIQSYAGDCSICPSETHNDLPSPGEVAKVLSDVRELLFPGLTTGRRPSGAAMRAQIEARVAQLRVTLTQQIFVGLHRRCMPKNHDCSQCEHLARNVADRFLTQLPEIRATLMTDVRAAWDGDPAASDADEIIFSYPGLYAICAYRIAHALLLLGASTVPRMITEIAHSETGIDIHPAATIGPSFFIDHGTGVVIGATSTIGSRVRIYQGVTLGALSLPTSKVRALANTRRHPTIEDDVIIYANATILGGDTVIARGTVIGANAWITRSVEGKIAAGTRQLLPEASATE